MAKATNKSNQNDIAEELNAKHTRLIAIQNELRVVFDYKWIKIVGILVKQFKLDHPGTLLPYDTDEMQKKCDALRREYDEIRAELAPFYPEFSSKQ